MSRPSPKLNEKFRNSAKKPMLKGSTKVVMDTPNHGSEQLFAHKDTRPIKIEFNFEGNYMQVSKLPPNDPHTSIMIKSQPYWRLVHNLLTAATSNPTKPSRKPLTWLQSRASGDENMGINGPARYTSLRWRPLKWGGIMWWSTYILHSTLLEETWLSSNVLISYQESDKCKLAYPNKVIFLPSWFHRCKEINKVFWRRNYRMERRIFSDFTNNFSHDIVYADPIFTPSR